MNFWTLEEYQKFISTFEKGTKGYLMFQTLFWTGCREGEMLALAKEDIDFENNLIHIRKTYYREKGVDYITTPKTEESVRTINIPDFLKQELKDYCDRLYEYPNDLRIFAVSARAVQKQMQRHSIKADIKPIEVHSIRHSSTAYLISQGVAPMVIKERMGHKDIRITLNTYGHLYPSEQRKVADMMDQIIQQKLESTENGNAPAGNKGIPE